MKWASKRRSFRNTTEHSYLVTNIVCTRKPGKLSKLSSWPDHTTHHPPHTQLCLDRHIRHTSVQIRWRSRDIKNETIEKKCSKQIKGRLIEARILSRLNGLGNMELFCDNFEGYRIFLDWVFFFLVSHAPYMLGNLMKNKTITLKFPHKCEIHGHVYECGRYPVLTLSCKFLWLMRWGGSGCKIWGIHKKVKISASTPN